MTDIFINKPEVTEYLESARRFCEYMESDSEVEPVEFLKQVRSLLLVLYQKALTFPLHDGDTDGDTEDLLGEGYFVVLKLIGRKVGTMDYYYHVYDPTNLDNENSVAGLLTDDLGDIYRDLKMALLQLNTDSEIAKEDALWSLHFSFRSHYGAHIINALYAIHFFLQYE